MILNNYWNWKSYIEKNPMGNSGNTSTNIGLINTSGTSAQFGNGSANNGYMSTHIGLLYNWAIKRALSAVVGSSDTAVQATDYNLGNDITSSFSNVSVTTSTTADGNSEKTIVTVSGANSTGSAIIIKEMGITAFAYSTQGTGSGNTVLLIRHVLDTPLTVANGQTFTLTLTWTEGSTTVSATRNVLNLEKGTVEKVEEKKVDEKSEELTKEVDEPVVEEEPKEEDESEVVEPEEETEEEPEEQEETNER
jgi:hypothetical protein